MNKSIYIQIVILILVFPVAGQCSSYEGASRDFFTKRNSFRYNVPFDSATTSGTIPKCHHLRVFERQTVETMRSHIDRWNLSDDKKKFLKNYSQRVDDWPVFHGGWLIVSMGGGHVGESFYFVRKKNTTTKQRLINLLETNELSRNRRCAVLLFGHYLETAQKEKMKKVFMSIQRNHGKDMTWFEKYHSPVGVNIWNNLMTKYFLPSPDYLKSINAIKHSYSDTELKIKSKNILELIDGLYTKVEFNSVKARILLTRAKAQALSGKKIMAIQTIDLFIKEFGPQFLNKEEGKFIFRDKLVSLDYPIIEKPFNFARGLRVEILDDWEQGAKFPSVIYSKGPKVPYEELDEYRMKFSESKFQQILGQMPSLPPEILSGIIEKNDTELLRVIARSKHNFSGETLNTAIEKISHHEILLDLWKKTDQLIQGKKFNLNKQSLQQSMRKNFFEQKILKFYLNHNFKFDTYLESNQKVFKEVLLRNRFETLDLIRTYQPEYISIYTEDKPFLLNLIEKRKKEALRYLLDHGLDPNSSIEGKPLLYYTIKGVGEYEDYKGHLEIAKNLIKQGANIYLPHNDTFFLHDLLRKTTLDYSPFRFSQHRKGRLSSKFHEKLKERREKQLEKRRQRIIDDIEQIIKVSVEQGFSINREDAVGETLFEIASKKNIKPLIKILLKYGVQVNTRGKRGNSPLHYAVQNGSTKIAKLILKHGGNPNDQNKLGKTPLFLAVQYNHPEIVRLMLENGARPNLKTKKGETPLEYLLSKHWISYQLEEKMDSRFKKSETEQYGHNLKSIFQSRKKLKELLNKYGAELESKNIDK